MLNILKAFNDANEIAEQQRIEQVTYHIETGMLPAEAEQTIRTPIIQHGVNANRKVLEAAAQHSLEQGLTNRLMKVDELFAASTMDH
jgi:hypothetical protein